MKALRIAASQFARKVTCYSGLSGLVYQMDSRPRILMFHGVGDRELPAGAFRAQLLFLMRYFRIVSLEEVWRGENATRSRRPKVALTFDDGLRNNFSVAYPILRELDARATFFVCPGLIESGRWLWNHECRARLRWMSIEDRRQFAADLGLDLCEVKPVIEKLKFMSHAERRQAEAELRLRTASFVPTQQQCQQYDLMTWEQLRSLDQRLITIGGHSTNHEILSMLEPGHLEREVADCRSWLERELHRPVPDFCYPNGAINTAVVECVSRHFDSAVTTTEGLVPSPPPRWELPRISIADNVPDLAWRMHRPTG